MKRLLEKLNHTLTRGGLREGASPWIEVNVGDDGIPRVALRESLFPRERRFVRKLQTSRALPPNSRVVFYVDEASGKVKVTASPKQVALQAACLLESMDNRTGR